MRWSAASERPPFVFLDPSQTGPPLEGGHYSCRLSGGPLGSAGSLFSGRMGPTSPSAVLRSPVILLCTWAGGGRPPTFSALPQPIEGGCGHTLQPWGVPPGTEEGQADPGWSQQGPG